MPLPDLKTKVLEAVGVRSGKARFVREVHAALGRHDLAIADIERALAELEADEAIERTWQQWLGEYLASHRCS